MFRLKEFYDAVFGIVCIASSSVVDIKFDCLIADSTMCLSARGA